MSSVAHDGGRLAKLGLAAALASRVLGRLVGIVLVVLLAREASPNTVAVYGYLLGTATLVATFTDLGVAAVAGREVAAGRLPADGALHAALWPQAASVAAACVATVALTLLAGPDAVPGAALALTVAFVVITGFLNLWAEMLRVTGRVVVEGGLQVASAVALMVGGVLVIRSGGDATDLLVIVVLKEAVVLAVSVALVRPRPRPEQVRSRRLLRQSLWLGVSSVGLVVLWRQGMVVIGAAGTLGALAAYVVASRFLDAGVTIAQTAGFGLVPGMSALASEPAAFRHEAHRYLGMATLVGAGVALIGVLAARPITVIPFGERWGEAVPAVRVIALAGLPILVGYVAWTLLLARRQVRWLAAGSAAGAVTGVALSAALVAWRPDALSAMIGTAVGAAVLVAVLLAGLRDLFLPSAYPNDGTRSRRLRTTDPEAIVSHFFQDYVNRGKPGYSYLLRRPRQSLAVLIALSRLTRLEANPSYEFEGLVMRAALSRRSALRRVIAPVTSVLTLPHDPAGYELGSSKQTLRRKVRCARKLGVYWDKVEDSQERRDLLQLANSWEQIHPSEQYRNVELDNTGLLNYRLWLVAYSGEGRALVLAVVAVDNEWAFLRYFRTLGAGEDYSNARYLVMLALVRCLVGLGARYLFDESSPVGLPNGLRLYQRTVGFRTVRVRLTQPGAPRAQRH